MTLGMPASEHPRITEAAQGFFFFNFFFSFSKPEVALKILD